MNRDPGVLTDRATYEDPHRIAKGMTYVLVNGRFAIDQGRFTQARSGRVLHRQDHVPTGP